MLIEFLKPRTPQRNNDHRHNHDSQHRMRQQQREINRPNPALPLKRNVPDAIVIRQIGNQKRRRRQKRRDHERLVHRNLARPNPHIPASQQHRTSPIQSRIQRRMRKHLPHHLAPVSVHDCAAATIRPITQSSIAESVYGRSTAAPQLARALTFITVRCFLIFAVRSSHITAESCRKPLIPTTPVYASPSHASATSPAHSSSSTPPKHKPATTRDSPPAPQ